VGALAFIKESVCKRDAPFEKIYYLDWEDIFWEQCEESRRYKNMAAECKIKFLVSQPVMMSH